jgi:hypothetical protein
MNLLWKKDRVDWGLRNFRGWDEPMRCLSRGNETAPFLVFKITFFFFLFFFFKVKLFQHLVGNGDLKIGSHKRE